MFELVNLSLVSEDVESIVFELVILSLISEDVESIVFELVTLSLVSEDVESIVFELVTLSLKSIVEIPSVQSELHSNNEIRFKITNTKNINCIIFIFTFIFIYNKIIFIIYIIKTSIIKYVKL